VTWIQAFKKDVRRTPLGCQQAQYQGSVAEP
jgi:hypothetical protein